MMATKINRRNWLKSSALVAAGLTTTGLSNWSIAHPTMKGSVINTTDMAKVLNDLPNMQARLTSNENPFGPSEKARQAIIDSISDSYLYPWNSRRELISMIAAEEGLSEDHILLGAGSTELLMAGALHYGIQGGTILSADVTYMSLIKMAENYGASWEKVPLNKDLSYDFNALSGKVKDKTTLVYICNPNNPTGRVADAAELKSFCEKVSAKKPIFVDEAYIDYSENPKENSVISGIKKGQNLIVARTFSKVYAFAGLRVGYVVALPETIKALSIYTTSGGTISATSIAAALASYNDKEFLGHSVDKNNESKAFLCKVLKDEGYEYVPSETNFVLFPLKMNGLKFREEMLKRGVGIRSWEFYDTQWCRVSMGKMGDMEMFADAFSKLS